MKRRVTSPASATRQRSRYGNSTLRSPDAQRIQIMEILETGDLKRIELENTEDVEIINLFQGVYGVG